MRQVRTLLEELSKITHTPSPETQARWSANTKKFLDQLAKYPETAEDGKAFVILWAEGRAIVAYRHRRDAIAFVKDKQEHDDVVWVHYEKPFTKGGTRIKVRNKY